MYQRARENYPTTLILPSSLVHFKARLPCAFESEQNGVNDNGQRTTAINTLEWPVSNRSCEFFVVGPLGFVQ